MPKVKGKAMTQKCLSVVVVALSPITFMPKKLDTKLIGRKSTVTTVNTKIALLLSSWKVSTNCTFWMASDLALPVNSSQFFICSPSLINISSMALHSKSYLSLRVILGVPKVFGLSDARRRDKTLSCSLSTSFTIVISSWKPFSLSSNRLLASFFTLSVYNGRLAWTVFSSSEDIPGPLSIRRRDERCQWFHYEGPHR